MKYEAIWKPGLALVLGVMTCLAMADDSRIHPDLLAEMSQMDRSEHFSVSRETGQINVIINLDPGSYRDVGRYFVSGRSTERAAVQRHIRRQQDRVLEHLTGQERARVSYLFQAQHAISASLTPEEIRRMSRRPEVELIEIRPIAEIMHNESHPLTNTDQVHAAGFTGDGITIAVIDDGIESNHPAFGGHSGFPTAKVIGGYDFADNDADPRNDCQAQSHGTAVAGVAAGNGGGIIGSAPDAKIVFLKVQGASICGQPSLNGDIIGAIDWVVANQETYGIDLINMSLGGGSFSSTCDSSSTAYRNAINAAYNAGIIIIAASGNDGTCNAIARPACFTNVISVGAVYDDDVGNPGFCVSSNSCANTQQHSACAASGRVACFDDAQADGVTCYSNSASFLDILAPSNCARTAATGGGTNNCFGGTSSASPYAAGVAATLLEAAGGSGMLDNDDMRTLLTDNGVNVTDSKNNRTTPRVDTLAAFNALDVGGPSGELDNGVPVGNLSGAQGSETFYTVELPAGAANLVISTSGGSGDVDLYVRHGNPPTLSVYDCRPYRWGNDETCEFGSPQGGTWHIMLHAYAAYSGVTLVASWDEPSSAPCSNCDEYSGNLSGSGASEVQPNGNWYQATSAGTHQGWLSGPAGTDFDLRLFRWNGSQWVQVASATTPDSEEHISYNGTAGYYYWRIESYSGSGPYTFWLQRP
jgi:serine protease